MKLFSILLTLPLFVNIRQEIEDRTKYVLYFHFPRNVSNDFGHPLYVLVVVVGRFEDERGHHVCTIQTYTCTLALARACATKPICCVLFGLNTYITMMERGQARSARDARLCDGVDVLLRSKLIRIPRRLNYDAICRHISFYTTVCAQSAPHNTSPAMCACFCARILLINTLKCVLIHRCVDARVFVAGPRPTAAVGRLAEHIFVVEHGTARHRRSLNCVVIDRRTSSPLNNDRKTERPQ